MGLKPEMELTLKRYITNMDLKMDPEIELTPKIDLTLVLIW